MRTMTTVEALKWSLEHAICTLLTRGGIPLFPCPFCGCTVPRRAHHTDDCPYAAACRALEAAELEEHEQRLRQERAALEWRTDDA